MKTTIFVPPDFGKDLGKMHEHVDGAVNWSPLNADRLVVVSTSIIVQPVI